MEDMAITTEAVAEVDITEAVAGPHQETQAPTAAVDLRIPEVYAMHQVRTAPAELQVELHCRIINQVLQWEETVILHPSAAPDLLFFKLIHFQRFQLSIIPS
jgi:hypothetical protein